MGEKVDVRAADGRYGGADTGVRGDLLLILDAESSVASVSRPARPDAR